MNLSLLLYHTLTSGLIGPVLPSICLGSILANKWRFLFPRLGVYINASPVKLGPRVWLQAVSVGEVSIAAAIVKMLLIYIPNVQILVTSTTLRGLDFARSELGLIAQIAPLPFDFPWAVWGIIRRFQPHIYVSLETEIWPGLIWALQKSNTACLLINGRLSLYSFQYYTRIKTLIGSTLKYLVGLSMISQIDAIRIISLGANPALVEVNGNIKYFGLLNKVRKKLIYQVVPLFVLGDAPLLVAGSVHAGEEEQIFGAFVNVLKYYPKAVLAVAPRHIEKANFWLEVCKKFSLKAQRFSLLTPDCPRRSITRVIVVDVIGQLMNIYGLARTAYIGASLVPQGGQNPMEAAIWGIPCQWGPYMEDFLEVVEMLNEAGVGIEVTDSFSLSRVWLSILDNPKSVNIQENKFFEILSRSYGALNAGVGLILRHLNK